MNRGEVVTLLGRNGAGRTTTLRAIMGLTGRRTGSIRVGGRETIGMSTHKIAHCGVGYCPEERGIFSSLSCEENLMLPPLVGERERGDVARRDLFDVPEPEGAPRAARARGFRAANSRCSRSRAFCAPGANLLLLDEISEGLAPVIVQTLARMILMLKSRGYTIVMVEQNFRFAAPLADRFYVMEHGNIVEHFSAGELEAKMPVLHELLGV